MTGNWFWVILIVAIVIGALAYSLYTAPIQEDDFHLYDPRSDGEGMDTRDERNGE